MPITIFQVQSKFTLVMVKVKAFTRIFLPLCLLSLKLLCGVPLPYPTIHAIRFARMYSCTHYTVVYPCYGLQNVHCTPSYPCYCCHLIHFNRLLPVGALFGFISIMPLILKELSVLGALPLAISCYHLPCTKARIIHDPLRAPLAARIIHECVDAGE